MNAFATCWMPEASYSSPEIGHYVQCPECGGIGKVMKYDPIFDKEYPWPCPTCDGNKLIYVED